MGTHLRQRSRDSYLTVDTTSVSQSLRAEVLGRVGQCRFAGETSLGDLHAFRVRQSWVLFHLMHQYTYSVALRYTVLCLTISMEWI